MSALTAHSRHRRGCATAGLLTATLILFRGGAASAQTLPSDGQQVDINIEWATSDIVQRTALWTAAGETINRSADLGLDALFGRTDQRRTKDVLARLARAWFVNLPVAALTQGAAHDSGHFARLAETGPNSGRRRMAQWPWPVPIAISVEYVPSPESGEFSPTAALAVLGGGEQASTLMKDRLAERIYSRDSADYFDWMLLAYASLDYPVYAWTDLNGSIEGEAGDFSQYAGVLTVLQPGIRPGSEDRTTSDLEQSAWLNLVDYSLWQAVSQVVRYVATGQRRTRNSTLALGRLRFVPSAYATLGSLGLERGGNVRLLSASLLTSINVREVSSPVGGRLWGAGVGVRSRAPARLLPEGKLDVWQRTGRKPGFRLELGTRRTFSIGARPLETSARIGYKTEGYLVDSPMRASLLAAVGAGVRF